MYLTLRQELPEARKSCLYIMMHHTIARLSKTNSPTICESQYFCIIERLKPVHQHTATQTSSTTHNNHALVLSAERLLPGTSPSKWIFQ